MLPCQYFHQDKVTGTVSATRGAVVRPFQEVFNFRDIGGMRTSDGLTLKTGVLYRSEALNRMTVPDLAKLSEFGIRLICDLRSPEESKRAQPRWTPQTAIPVINLPLNESPEHDVRAKTLIRFLFAANGDAHYRAFTRAYYRHMAFGQTSRIREIITLLSMEGSLPALIHCSAGRDRTGLLAAFIQLLAGVPYETVQDEYLLTNDYFGPRLERLIGVARVLTLFQVPTERIRLVFMAQPEFLDDVHQSIVKDYGDVETYLRAACKIAPDTLEKVKRRLLA